MAEGPRRSYYDVLGVSPDAGPEDIKAAYRRAARTSHPDLGGSAARFHDVAVAYETLGDPQRRERYDADTGRRRAPSARPGADPGSPARGAAADTGRSTIAEDDAASSAPLYHPPFSPSAPPALPLLLAGRQSHGSPRKPGVFARMSGAARSRIDGELRTAALLERALLPTFPAARLVNGIDFGDAGSTTAGHVLLAGYRLAVIDSLAAPPGNFSWDGRSLRHQGRPVEVRLFRTVRNLQELFPGSRVAGWLVLHGPPDNPFAPVIDVPPGFDRSSATVPQVVNAGTAVRTIRNFLATGPTPNVVQLPVLERLLAVAGS